MKSSGSNCCNWWSDRPPFRWAFCSAPTWEECAWAACCYRVTFRRANIPLRIYAIIEGGIGVCGLLVLLILPLLDHLYAAIGGQGFFGILLRAVIAAICLLPPTLLMGASLPAIARYVESSPRGVSWLGFFYGGNIAGAVFGCLLAGFYLLRVYDMPTATYVAAAINAGVAWLSYRLSTRTPYQPSPPDAIAGPRGIERAFISPSRFRA